MKLYYEKLQTKCDIKSHLKIVINNIGKKVFESEKQETEQLALLVKIYNDDNIEKPIKEFVQIESQASYTELLLGSLNNILR